MTSKHSFKPKARILAQLGDQLIKNESIALIELVKNSYDADASSVEIFLHLGDVENEPYIIIKDNGSGMSFDTVVNNWLQPGTDFKKKQLEAKRVSKIFKRLPIGEKGIGRFGVHKLGDQVEMCTREFNEEEVNVFIDWGEVEKEEFLEDFTVEVTTQAKGKIYSMNETGTYLKISKLKRFWTKKDVRNVYRSVNSLTSPFEEKENNFLVDFKVSNPKMVENLLTWDQIKDLSLFQFSIEIEGKLITKFHYEFTPWKELKKIKSRVVDESDESIKKILQLYTQEKSPIDLLDHGIGKITLRGHIFDRDNYTLSLVNISDKKGFKEYLTQNSGMKVFRNGLRVYDYGEPGNDWLGLALGRINNPTKGLSNNLIIGSVDIDRSNEQLIEKTNREGFIDNSAYQAFLSSIIYALGLVQVLRFGDKLRLREIYSGHISKEPVLEPIRILKNKIDKLSFPESQKKELTLLIDKVESEYLEMKKVLLQSSSSGLSLGFAIHEVEKIILELTRIVAKEKAGDRVTNLVSHLHNLIDNYSSIIRTSKVKTIELGTIVEQALFNTEYRFEAHGVEIIYSKSFDFKNTKIKAPSNLIISSLMNIFDNSIYWLDYSNTKNKKILIDISIVSSDQVALNIVDNGPGFTIPSEDAKRVFFTGKTNGMGMGLHVVNEIMNNIEGELVLDDEDYLSENFNEFKKGAKVSLVFKV